ncbi:MAG TPA: monofunctional biosynthetic peptidoglycan transglycosylase [Pseudomonadales bacterium]|nr:monofunctional biosynthetic peptidoglycan transglycosylase [Pseudomonadales bacterium]
MTKRLLWGALAALLLYQVWIFAQLVWFRTHNPETTAFMQHRLAELQEENPNAKLQHKWVPYEAMSTQLKRAVISAEDARFMQHDGFDFAGIEEAFWKDLKHGKIVAGGSSISQQLAKNLFLSASHNPLRKLEEAFITIMMEAVLSKRRIFELYLNLIEWGNGVFGAEAAARHYYGVSAAQLSNYQSARLAAMIPNPRFYDKVRSTARLSRKTSIIQDRMPSAWIPK